MSVVAVFVAAVANGDIDESGFIFSTFAVERRPTNAADADADAAAPPLRNPMTPRVLLLLLVRQSKVVVVMIAVVDDKSDLLVVADDDFSLRLLFCKFLLSSFRRRCRCCDEESATAKAAN